MSEDADLTGRGAEILLPPQGNPFKSASGGDPPADLTPPEVEARVGPPAGQGQAAAAGPTAPEAGVGGSEEPADLSPEDIAALFPSTQDERNAIPAAEPAPPPLTPDQIAAMTADASNAPPAAHLGARGPMRTPGAAPAREPAHPIDISSFDPDAPIGRGVSPAPSLETRLRGAPGPLPAGKSAIRGKVDIEAFDPDAPVGAALPQAVPVDALAGPAPAADFQPFEPFSPPDSPPPVAASPESSPAVAAPLPAPVGGQASVVVSTAESTITAVASAPPAEEEGPGDIDSTDALPFVPPIPLPAPADASIVEKLITDERVNALWERIDRIERLAVEDENSLPKQRTQNFENLKAARNLMLGGRQNYEEAMRYVDEVEAALSYIKRVRRWSYSWGTFILLYNLIWLVLLIIGYLSAARIAETFASAGVFDKQFGFAIWVTIVSGGLGGVSKSFFSLATHVIKQDFDTQHRMWYYASPLIGSIMGIFVILISQVGIIAASAGSIGGTGSAGFAVYILAWVVGFQQNLVLQLVEKVKEAILPDEQNKPA